VDLNQLGGIGMTKRLISTMAIILSFIPAFGWGALIKNKISIFIIMGMHLTKV